MRQTLIALSLLAVLAGCGGPSTPPEEEAPAVWTSGDDEPLESPDDEE